MHDSAEALHRQTAANLKELFGRTAAKPSEAEEECAGSAFGYLRGIRDRSLMLELRFRDGNTVAFPYSWLGPVWFNPSVGILLKFTGDVVTLVLIRGSNLDAVADGRAANLTDRGIARHRITYVREMDENELRAAGEGQPTIDRIEVAEFESSEEQRTWLARVAPMFVRQPT